MARLNYRNNIAPKIVNDTNDRIFKSFKDKGYIKENDNDVIEFIEDSSISICTSLSMKITGYFMKNDPSQVNIHAPIASSILAVFSGMALAKELANGNKENPEIIFDDMIEASPIDTFDEYLLEKIGIEYLSEEHKQLSSFIKKTYADNWIYMNKEAQKQGLRPQILFVVDSLIILLKIGILIENKRLGL